MTTTPDAGNENARHIANCDEQLRAQTRSCALAAKVAEVQAENKFLNAENLELAAVQAALKQPSPLQPLCTSN